jgi:tryptophan synthase alpha chain
MNRIDKLFNEKKANILSIFFTAGFPKLDSTIEIAQQLEQAGVDMIEIGIPFSDPIADGPVIQASNKIALDNGMTVKLLLEQVTKIRKTVSIPIVLMGYLNPVLQYGMEKFCKAARESGVDGIILPDLPMDEYLSLYQGLMTKFELHAIFLISPTTSEQRIQKIDEVSGGFIYAVSASSTTGSKSEFTEQQIEYFNRLKSMQLRNPFLIGFGISSQESFAKASLYSSGAIIGSAFINFLKDNPSDTVTQFVKRIKG